MANVLKTDLNCLGRDLGYRQTALLISSEMVSDVNVNINDHPTLAKVIN